MADEFTDVLRQANLRVTAARVAVLRTLDQESHLDADQIRDRVRERLGSISGQAVYDALNGMTQAGILRRVEPAGVRARYEFATDNHHHIVCRGCGKMEDVPCTVDHAPCINPKEIPAAWTLTEAEVIYWGYCPQCLSSERIA